MKNLINSLCRKDGKASSKGYICVPRAILNNVFEGAPADKNASLLFLALLTFSAYSAYEKKVKGKRIPLQPGELVMTVRELADCSGIHFSWVNRLLTQFELRGLISTRTCQNCRVIKVVQHYELTHYGADPAKKQVPPKKLPPKPDPIADLERRFGHLVKPIPR